MLYKIIFLILFYYYATSFVIFLIKKFYHICVCFILNYILVLNVNFLILFLYIFFSSLLFPLIGDINLKSRIIVCMMSHHHNEFVDLTTMQRK